MNYRNVFIGTAAILVAALVFNLPVVSATQINIMYWNGAQWVKWDDVQISNENFIRKTVTIKNIGGIFWTNAKVIINITNNTAASLETVHIYRCRGLSPADCVKTVTPEMRTILNNKVSLEMIWNDVSQVVTSCSSSPSNCMEFTNILFLFKVNDGGKTIRVGMWDKVERRTRNFAEPYLFQYTTDQINLRAASLDFVSPIRDFLNTYLTVPFNPGWVSGVVFAGANKLYEISTSSSDLGSPSPTFSVKNHSSGEITSIAKDYSFVFPESGGNVFIPITFNLNPSFTCGLYGCETDKGESSSTCCYDCPCSPGLYCDGGTGGSCRQESAISLSLYETPLTVVENCNEQHTINVTAKIDYAPSDSSLTRSEYILNGTKYQATCVEILDDVFRCLITVPPMPNCQAGEYTIGPNYLNFTIIYSDGKNQRSKILVMQFPDIIVGSYTCGQSGCESGLGENSGNCCFDCGCPQGYCDIANSAQPSTGTCRQDPTSSDLWVSVDPTHFYTHNTGGDNTLLGVQIRNAPSSLEVTDDSCSLKCSYGDYTCSASCDVSCSRVGSDPSVYDASCTLSFIVSSYDNRNDYTLVPTFNITVTYNNGSSGKITKTFSRKLSTLSIGANWCGDLICGANEDNNNCCFDCDCPDGYFCDTANIGAPTSGDTCRSESSIMLVIDGLSETEFDYHDVSHYTTLMAHVDNAPSSLNGTLSCMFGDGTGPYCSMDCSTIKDAFSHTIRCNLSIPIIDYETSMFYDPDTKKIVIGPNTLTYMTTFNDGNGVVSKELNTSFPNILINVIPRCGSGAGYLGLGEEYCTPYNRSAACETKLGEDWTTCCCDCPCPEEQYCYLSGYEGDPGMCREVGSITLSVENLDPDPKKCYIMPPETERKRCVFTRPQLVATVRIEPESNYSYVDAEFDIEGEKTRANCISVSEDPPFNTFNCSGSVFNLERETAIGEGTEEKHVTVSMSIESTGLLDTTVSGRGSFDITREESDALKKLEEQIADFDRLQGELESKKTKIYIILGIIIGATIAACIMPWTAPLCKMLVAFSICVSVDLISVIIALGTTIDTVKRINTELSNAAGPIPMHAEELNLEYGFAQATQTVLKGVGCMMTFGGGFGAISQTAEASGTIGFESPWASQLLGTTPQVNYPLSITQQFTNWCIEAPERCGA